MTVERIAIGNTRSYDPISRITISRASGMWLWDDAGNAYIDLTSGYSVTNLGHCFAPVIRAATEQMKRLDHVTGQTHQPQQRLAQKLKDIFEPRLAETGSQEARVAFSTSGARAIEVAIQCALQYRPGKTLRLESAFHGRTLALSCEKIGFVNQLDAAYYPNCNRCPLNKTFPTCDLACTTQLFDYIDELGHTISSILVEPILGVAGWIVPPDNFLKQLRKKTAEKGILLIADEVQTALGRCGAWTRFEQIPVQPDILVIGKSLAAGVAAISATIGREEIMNSAAPGSLTETFAANPVACAAALATLDHLTDAAVFSRATEIGKRLRACCESALGIAEATSRQCDGFGSPSVSGIGASCVLQFVGAPKAASTQAHHFAQRCFDQGLITHLAGKRRDRVVLLPPLNLSDAELPQICDHIASVAGDSFERRQPI
jgi:4-aminobutyrate aminotransferase-like enzyme